MNKEHEAIFREGSAHWNRWRKDNPHITPDLTGIELQDINLKDFKLDGITLNNAHFFNVKLKRGELLKGVNLNDATIKNSDFSNSDLTNVNMMNTNILSSHFEGTNLFSAKLALSRITSSWFDNAKLEYSKLYGTQFLSTILRGGNFDNSDLVDTFFRSCELSKSSFKKSLFAYAVFAFCDLKEVVFNDCIPAAPSSLDLHSLQSLNRSNEKFLKELGYPEDFLTYIPANEHSSCFISYSSKNQEFSDKLVSDLKNQGVLCWYFPKNATYGDTIFQEITNGIRKFDKVIAILSEDSLKSPYVIKEIERAIAKEDDLQKNGIDEVILIPISLDKAIFSSTIYFKTDILKRTIGNFENWGKADSYKEAFNALLKSLKKVNEKKESGRR